MLNCMKMDSIFTGEIANNHETFPLRGLQAGFAGMEFKYYSGSLVTP